MQTIWLFTALQGWTEFKSTLWHHTISGSFIILWLFLPSFLFGEYIFMVSKIDAAIYTKL